MLTPFVRCTWADKRELRDSSCPMAADCEQSLDSRRFHMGHQNQDNHANQLNPNNDAYWQSRGDDERPDDWQERARTDGDDD